MCTQKTKNHKKVVDRFMGNVELYKQASPILGLREKGIENKRNVLTPNTLYPNHHCKHMKLPHEWWGSCHVVTEGAAMQSIAVTLQFINYQLTKNSNLVTKNTRLSNMLFLVFFCVLAGKAS